MHRRMTVPILLVLAIVVALTAVTLTTTPAAAASELQLTRYPYLTDVVSDGVTYNATVNWATDQSQATGYATYGQDGVELSTAHRANGSKTSITVNSVPEYQWKAKITGLLPETTYTYRVFFSNPTFDLLGTDASLTFTTPPPPGGSSPFTFAVIGDWGATDSTGANPDQANLLAQLGASGASFAVSTGDIGYSGGSQTNYGDLFQTGANISGVFGPSFYKNVGDSIPMFPAPGNHGLNSTFLNIWPQPVAPVLSGGRYAYDSYSLPGTKTASYPSVWYAFNVGNARFYILTAAWANSNVGNGTLYSRDYEAHWKPTSAEYQWLAQDLAANPTPLKFATFHFPMYSDNKTETTDPYLHGPGSLAQLLTQYGVQFVFNGHAHIYERNYQMPGESFASYVIGAGGAPLEPLGKTSVVRRVRPRLEQLEEQGVRDRKCARPDLEGAGLQLPVRHGRRHSGDDARRELARAVVRRDHVLLLRQTQDLSVRHAAGGGAGEAPPPAAAMRPAPPGSCSGSRRSWNPAAPP